MHMLMTICPHEGQMVHMMVICPHANNQRGKLIKKERKFIYATAAGDLKRILRFVWNLLAFKRRVGGLPLFIMDTHLDFKKPMALHLDVPESDKKQ